MRSTVDSLCCMHPFYAFYAELSPFRLPACTRRVSSLYVVTVLILADKGYNEGVSHFKSVEAIEATRLPTKKPGPLH